MLSRVFVHLGILLWVCLAAVRGEDPLKTQRFYYQGQKESPAFIYNFQGKKWAVNEKNGVSSNFTGPYMPQTFPPPPHWKGEQVSYYHSEDWKINGTVRGDDRWFFIQWENGSWWSEAQLVASYKCAGRPGMRVPA